MVSRYDARRQPDSEVCTVTHSTHFDFLQPIDPERLMGALRGQLGIPADHPIDNITTGALNRATYANATRIGSRPGGFMAALDLTICPEGETVCGDPWHLPSEEWPQATHWRSDGNTRTSNLAECANTGQQFYVRVRLDTAYNSILGDLQEFHEEIFFAAMETLDWEGSDWEGSVVIHDERDGTFKLLVIGSLPVYAPLR